jgi:hypothetical protein
MTYGGPNTYVEREMEVWHEGKRIAKERGHQSFQLPLSDDAAFGFSDGKDGEGKEVVKFHDTYPVQSKVPGAGDYSRASGSFEFGLPSLKTHPRQILEPAFPLEIVDGTEALLWAVFVDEPAELPAGATPEERAKRAGTAFLFRVRTADGK